ncbi:MAG: hypothetical protein JWM64_1582 [Frankiales bacterium]|nr:hypothetical protein [Frankiales bacterium]
MAKTKEPKAGKGPGKGGPAKAEKVKVKVKGRLLERVTNLVGVLFALSLVAEKVVSG